MDGQSRPSFNPTSSTFARQVVLHYMTFSLFQRPLSPHGPERCSDHFSVLWKKVSDLGKRGRRTKSSKKLCSLQIDGSFH